MTAEDKLIAAFAPNYCDGECALRSQPSPCRWCKEDAADFISKVRAAGWLLIPPFDTPEGQEVVERGRFAMMRNTYITGLKVALAIAEDRASECRAEEQRHRSGDVAFTPEQNAMWERMERQCAMEAECIANKIRRLVEGAPRAMREAQK